jgi:hypothetical protein
MASSTQRNVVIASAVAIGMSGALYMFKNREVISRRMRAKSLSKNFKKYKEEAEEAIFLALECGEAMRKCVEGRKQKTNWKDDNGIDPGGLFVYFVMRSSKVHVYAVW